VGEWTAETGWIHRTPISNYTSSVLAYGQNRVSRVGALYIAKDDSAAATANGTMLLGAQIYSDATTTKEIIAYDDSNDAVQKYGYIVTSKIYSQNIQEAWQKIYARFKKLLDSGDSITIKYRVNDVAPTQATITWVDTDTFTTTTDVSAYVAGDEVEILQGDGAGKCAHISSISVNAGTYTVNLDDTFTGVTTNTAKARFQKWVKAGVCTDQTVKWYNYPLGVSDTWIQFKVCMQFTGKNELDDLILINEPQQLAK